MEHEVYVPFSAGSVRAALADTERVARCVPGLQRAAEAPGDAEDTGATAGSAGETATGTPAAEAAGSGQGEHAYPGARMTGRLRVRVGGSTITYRGSLTLTPVGAADGSEAFEQFEVTGSGSEARGEGTAELTLTLAPRSSDDGEGTTLVCTGTVTGTGRLAALEDKATTSAGIRLLDRFGTALADSIRQEPPAGSAEAEGVREGDEGPVAGGIGAPGDNERAIPGIPEPEQGSTPLFETEVPPSSLGRDGEPAEALGPEPGGEDAEPGAEGYEGPLEPLAAEAAHARRTMIGRSAEEVDHAPPRGRYAPVPAPEPATATATLRWAAPAAAVVVAGAVVLGRVLRRRR
ncbi:hypothetical protein [Streptomyces iconiensis]|uniref:Carbon monoxide dehydrogenase subunit G n=1 Tax=Streptomyces iconiensis TaxID=1384038 RepID=A0ABT7AAF7_9ACTN|nr:hypothetical protein [Streptomyces iconiensis]MDJ1138315.1 hypothetical protein [Streptomyces iconiensis]